MSKYEKLIIKILKGGSDSNIKFADLCNLLKYFSFYERIKGSHHIFYRENVEEILNLQPRHDMAKPYQVKQVRDIIVKYKLGAHDE